MPKETKNDQRSPQTAHFPKEGQGLSRNHKRQHPANDRSVTEPKLTQAKKAAQRPLFFSAKNRTDQAQQGKGSLRLLPPCPVAAASHTVTSRTDCSTPEKNQHGLTPKNQPPPGNHHHQNGAFPKTKWALDRRRDPSPDRLRRCLPHRQRTPKKGIRHHRNQLI